MGEEAKLILIVIVTGIVALSVGYLYLSANIFVDALKKPIRLVSFGMFLIDLGVLLVGAVTYQAYNGIDLFVFGIPLAQYFYALYVAGSAFVILGARQFSHRPAEKQ
jgi:hypothetical protein